MDELQVTRFGEVDVVDSRDVARMVEKRHDNLVRDIFGYIKIMENSTALKSEVSTERKIESSDFFIPSRYKDSTGRTLPCYLLTKKGCDMVANKMTGEKGVLFTAAYVTAFEKMREHIANGNHQPQIDFVKQSIAEAKVRNSRVREASIWLKIADKVNIPEYQTICAHYASSVLAGKEVLPLPDSSNRTYTAAEVGELLGGVSGNMVGRLANQHGLKTAEYGQQVWDKSPYSSKQIQAWRYNEKAVEQLRKIIGNVE